MRQHAIAARPLVSLCMFACVSCLLSSTLCSVYSCVLTCVRVPGWLASGEALKANITTMGPLVLPISEQMLFAFNLLMRKALGKKRLRPYIPDFKLAFEHVCIHTGGRGVIDEIEKQLSLTKDYVDPSRATLYRYGNVSSSSIW